MFDIAGLELTQLDCEKLLHPLAGGVILFCRNYHSPTQLRALTKSIRALRCPPLLTSVDHEGGRVQRFKAGFTTLPAMREIGNLWNKSSQDGKHWARETGYVLAAELRSCGVDFSFTPVLDLDYGQNSVIGDRALHNNAAIVFELAHDLMLGLKDAGMASVGKHFPGHGYVTADSHAELPVDNRAFTDIEQADLVPFRRLIRAGLNAVMPAHVVYEKVDAKAAGFSRTWLTEILRKRLGFDGAIFSDDLNMKGAAVAGGAPQRVDAALSAGCDIALMCNNPTAVEEILDRFHWDMPTASLTRMARMHGKPRPESMVKLRGSQRYTSATCGINAIGASGGKLPLIT